MASVSAAAAVAAEAPAAPAPAATKEDCTPYFDQLWFCYSPVYQMREYYVKGELDDCLSHWGRLYNCLKRRTRFKDEAAPIPEKAPGIWETRTKEEAREAWEEEFGHLWGGEEHATKAEEETI